MAACVRSISHGISPPLDDAKDKTDLGQSPKTQIELSPPPFVSLFSRTEERKRRTERSLNRARTREIFFESSAGMSFLEDFQAGLESLPTMLQRKYALMRDLDRSLQESQRQNEQRCEQEIEDIEHGVKSGNITPDTSLIRFSDDALDEQKHCIRIADEKVALAMQAYDLVDEHIQQLDQYLKKFDEELRRAERDLSVASGVDILNPDTNVKSARGSDSKGGRRKKTRLAAAAATVDTPSVELDLPMDPNEPTYCLCNQVSFGEMVACDNPDCKIEWFHYGCVGLRDPPRGKWYCSDCVGLPKRRKGK